MTDFEMNLNLGLTRNDMPPVEGDDDSMFQDLMRASANLAQKGDGVAGAGSIAQLGEELALKMPPRPSDNDVANYGRSAGVDLLSGEGFVPDDVAAMAKDAAKNEDKARTTKPKKPKKKHRVQATIRETGQDSMKYYLKSMGNHDLLKKNEEIVLAREIQILIGWEQKRIELEDRLSR
jgi:hypothetical protein